MRDLIKERDVRERFVMMDAYRVSGVVKHSAEASTAGNVFMLADTCEGAIEDEVLSQNPEAQASCKVLVDRDLIIVTGHIPKDVEIDTDATVRKVVHDAGYRNPGTDFNCLKVQLTDELRVCDSTCKSARDVSTDGVMIGYSSRETPKLLDTPAWMASELASQLTDVRETALLPYLLPDGRVRAYVKYELGQPVGVDRIAISVQHEKGIKRVQLEGDIWDEVIMPVVPANLLPDRSRVIIESLGQNIAGGPAAEVGISGCRSIFLDYGLGPWVWTDAVPRNDSLELKHRWGVYACRWIAKNVVAAGLADRIEVRVRYLRGSTAPISVLVDTFGTGVLSNDAIVDLIKANFDLTPSSLIRELDLRSPIHAWAAVCGHFGCDELPWERTSKASALRSGLPALGPRASAGAP